MPKLLRRRWSERARIVVLMLAVMIPSATLIAYSVIHLWSIHRDHAVEAAIQRDYQHVLAIAEKRIVARAYEVADETRQDFPTAGRFDQLQAFVDAHPNVLHAYMYDEEHGFQIASQPICAKDQQARDNTKKFTDMMTHWFEGEGKDFVAKLKMMKEKDGHDLYFTTDWYEQNDRWHFLPIVVFQPSRANAHQVALAGYTLTSNFIATQFFPDVLRTVLPHDGGNDANHPQTILMVRSMKDHSILAASADFDGVPELTENFDSTFPGLAIGIKLRGTTIAEISHRFLRTNLLIVGALSLLLIGGVYLVYRNVCREMALAKLKSDFVSNVSHELRTPLSLIRLYAETLELGRLPSTERQREYYEIIRKESDRLTALINNILDFSRIEAGRKEYEFRPTDVADLVRTTLESYRFQIEQHGFRFEQKIEDNLPSLRVDREAIARSVLNLVNNALKYSSADKYLAVSLYRSDGSVRLEVLDHGIGIPPTEQHKIFEKFYRVGDPLVHNTKGSGLGLSLVRHIVEAHGGAITVESEPGRGSKFTISLPAQAAMEREIRRAIA